MFDIIKAKRLDIAEFTFYRLSPPGKLVTFEVKPLSRLNKELTDAMFTRAVEQVEQTGFAFFTAGRERDIADLAAFCVVSWTGVTRDGKPVECTPENVLAFLKFALENGYEDEIDKLRNFAKSILTFREPIADASELGKE